MSKKFTVFLCCIFLLYLAVMYIKENTYKNNLPMDIEYVNSFEDNDIDITLYSEDIVVMDSYGYLFWLNVGTSDNSLDEVFKLLSSKSNYLPLEVHTTVPPSTILYDYEVNGDELIINLSEEFLNYKIDEEKEVVATLTNTLLGKVNAKKLYINVNGERLNILKSGKDISNGLARTKFLNIYYDCLSPYNSKEIVVYLLSNTSEEYLVPITFIVDDYVDEMDYIFSAVTGNKEVTANFHSSLVSNKDELTFSYSSGQLNINNNTNTINIIGNEKFFKQLFYSFESIDNIDIFSIRIEENDVQQTFYKHEFVEEINKV